MWDRGLVAAKDWMNGIRERSRGIVDNASSSGEAMVGAGLYAINSVTSAVVGGVVDFGRVFTSSQQRAQFFQGVGTVLSNPIQVTASHAWTGWQGMTHEDRLINAGAMLTGFGSFAKLGATTKLADVMPVGSRAGYAGPRMQVGAVGGDLRGAKTALKAEIFRIGQEGHALARHGGGVTSEQLFVRATTGVAPDGSSVVRNGQVVIPPSSTAFYSDELLAQSDLFIRQNYLDRAIALSKPGAQRVTIEGVDLSRPIGRGYDRVSATPGGIGPLRYHPELSRATGVYDYDSVTNSWRTTTIYVGH